MTSLLRVLRVCPGLAILAPAALAQDVLYTFHGDAAGDYLGWSVSGAGDVNGDGFSDVIVGVFGDDTNGDRSGSARVFSGVDGSILYTFHGDSTLDMFGISVSGAGDVNGDGYDDLIVGAVWGDENGKDRGSARVLSGADGSILYTLLGELTASQFGISVSGAGDVNGDGIPDMIVGAPRASNAGPYHGSARVFSGADGSVLHNFDGDGGQDEFGASVSGAGDVNADGFADLIVGAPRDDNQGKASGSARVFSGKDGSILYTFDGNSKGDLFGSSVAGAGDVNGDGYADVIVGAPFDKKNNKGSVRVCSGLDGSILYTFIGGSPEDQFGASVSGLGDVNGDGFDDVVVGSPGDDTNNGDDSGSASVFSGKDGSILYTLEGDSPGDSFGAALSGSGDVNDDAFGDLIVGAPLDDNPGKQAGSARVFSFCPCVIGTNYCGPANFNSTGQSAEISAVGSVYAQGNILRLTASLLPLNVFGYFLNSDVQGFTPFPPGSSGNLCLGGGIGRHVKQVGNSGAAGELVIDVDLTALPRPGGSHSVVAGETWNFQCWFRDKNPGATSNFTDGIEIVFK